MAGEGADGDRREGRAEGGGADRAEIAPGDVGQHRRAVEIAGLALVGRHAERGVALEMLGNAEAFARGELHVRRRHVVLEIDEGLAAAVGDLPHRARRRRSRRSRREPFQPTRRNRTRWRRPRRRPAPSARHEARPNEPVAAPATLMPGGSAPGTSAARLSLHCGLPLRWVVRCSVGFQPPDTATRSQAIRSALPVSVPDIDPGDGEPAAHAFDRRARQIARARLVGSSLSGRGGHLARIDHRRDGNAGLGQVGGVRNASSLSAKITARRPGATP